MLEQRRFSRISKHLTAELLTGEGLISAQVLNISIHGALLELDQGTVMTPKERVKMTLSLMQQAPPIEGIIRRIDGTRAGVEFVSCPLEIMAELRRLVSLNTGDERVLAKELKTLVDIHQQPQDKP